MTGVMPVAGRLDKSWAITMVAPRRNPYGEATIRATRMGMSEAISSDLGAAGSGRSDRTGVCRLPRTERAA